MVLKGQRVAESSQEKSLLKKKDEINEYKKKEIQKKKGYQQGTDFQN